MLLDQYRGLAKYNSWMNRKVLDACAQLDDSTRKRDLGAYFGSIHGTLNHVLLADRAWMMRFTGDETRFAFRNDAGEPVRIRSLDQELHSDFDTLRRERERLDEAIELWVFGLDQPTIERTLRWYSMNRKREYEQPLWWAISHFFNHQTHHRGQLGTLLNQLGLDLGVTDLGLFIAEDGRVEE
ncbi:MAG: DinB family protein [Myxococcales bacterium]|nr:DinB family protein [Myxococcales bacterium]